jgi:hypothetical protein
MTSDQLTPSPIPASLIAIAFVKSLSNRLSTIKNMFMKQETGHHLHLHHLNLIWGFSHKF